VGPGVGVGGIAVAVVRIRAWAQSRLSAASAVKREVQRMAAALHLGNAVGMWGDNVHHRRFGIGWRMI